MANSYGCGAQNHMSPHLRTIDRVFEDATFTGEINLSGRKLKEYPESEASTHDLVDTIAADLSKNRLSEIPQKVCEYSSLERLNCYHNVIKVIPVALQQLQNLTHLNLSRNQLTNIPQCISCLHNLEVLLATHNKLVSIPEEMCCLDKLMDLDVSCNEISHLPAPIGELKSLRSLNVRRNLLIELPPDISKLNLRKLDFSNNKIECIPTVFRKMETLEEIGLANNPLKQPPASVCTRGKQHIMKYLEKEAKKEEREQGIMNEVEMKRLVRKSLPPQQTNTAEEFQFRDFPENKWKRHTVLSNDSGYSTTDSLEKCGLSPSERIDYLTNGTSHRPELHTNGEFEEANRLSIRAAEAVRDHRQSREHERRQRYQGSPQQQQQQPILQPPSSQIYARPAPISLPVDQAASSTSPAITPKTPTPEQFQMPSPHQPMQYSPITGPSYYNNSPKTPETPVPIEYQNNVDQFSRELQRQKSEYERKKKEAEALRIQQEEDEKEQRRRAALRLQEEQRMLLEKQREEARLQEEARAREEARHKEEEQARLLREQEEQRMIEENKRQAKLAEEQRQAEEAQAKVENKKSKAKSGRNTATTSPSYGYPQPWHANNDSYYGHRYENRMVDTYNSMYYRHPVSKLRKPSQVSTKTEKEDKKPAKTTTTPSSGVRYRRTASDSSTKKDNPASAPNNTTKSNRSVHSKNGSISQRSSTSNTVSPSPSPRSSIGSTGPSPASSTSSIHKAGGDNKNTLPRSRTKVTDRLNNTSSTPSPSQTQPKTYGTERQNRGPSSSTGVPSSRMSPMSTKSPPSSATSTAGARRNHMTPEEEMRSHAPPLRSPNSDQPRGKGPLENTNSTSKLKQMQRDSVNNFMAKRTGSVSSDDDKKRSFVSSRSNFGSSIPGKRPGTSGSSMKTMDGYKEIDPAFTLRRQLEQQKEEMQQMENMRKIIESKLKVVLPDNLTETLRDGVLLCQLANSIRPRSVTSIHVPSPAVPKLTLAKCRKNVENFLDACRKIGVNRDSVCSTSDILEEKGLSRVALTIEALVAVTSIPKSCNV